MSAEASAPSTDVSSVGFRRWLRETYEVGKRYDDRPVAVPRDKSLLAPFMLDEKEGLRLWLCDVLFDREWGRDPSTGALLLPFERLEPLVRSTIAESARDAREGTNRITWLAEDHWREAIDLADAERWSRSDVVQKYVGHAQSIATRELAEKHHAERSGEGADDWASLFLGEDELAALTLPAALIEGVLPAASSGVLRGRDGAFKSFTALDWALHIAAGKPWCGHAVDPGAVLYIAGEGAYGFLSRITAWREHHGCRDPLPFTLRKTALNLHTPGPAFDHLLDWVEGHKTRLIVIDTLRRVSGGADGNGSDMGAVIDSIDRLKLAMREVNGSTLLLTHTTKSDTDTRGFSGIEDDADFVWHCQREESAPLVVLRHTKNKDGPELLPVSLRVENVADSLVLTSTTGATGPSAESKILSFLIYGTDEHEEGETAAVIRAKTGLAERTLFAALDRMVDAGDLVLTRETRPKRYAAVAAAARYL